MLAIGVLILFWAWTGSEKVFKLTIKYMQTRSFLPILLLLINAVFNTLNGQCTWNAASGNWSDASKWSNCGGSTPLATSDVLISGGTVSLDIAPTVQNCTLSWASITGSNNLTVTGNLAISGSSLLGQYRRCECDRHIFLTAGTIGNSNGTATGAL